MKKNYEAPVIVEEVISVEDIVAVSVDLGELPGDVNQGYPWGKE